MPRKNQTRRKLPAVEKLKEQIAATQALLRVPGYSLYADPEEPQRLGRFSVELECFLWNWGDYKRDPREVNGLGTTRHFVNAASINWPDLEWNPWLLRGIASIFDVPYRHDGADGRWAKFIGWAGCAAAGKAQPLDATVWTPTGPVKMGDIKVGDLVCTPNGKSAPVTGIFPQGEVAAIEVRLVDGSVTRCSLDHLWIISERGKKKLVDGHYLLNRHKQFSDDRNLLGVPFTKPVSFNERPTKLHPYLLGAMLANGMLCGYNGRASLNFSSSDPEIVSRVKSLVGAECELKVCSHPWDYRLVGIGAKRIKDILAEYGLIGKLASSKFIPTDFIYNTIECRIELLRGLFDCDAGVEDGKLVYCSTSPSLAQAVQLIVQSLGGTTRIHRKPSPKYTYRGETRYGQDCYICHVQYPNPRELFSLPRKRDAVKPLRKCSHRIIENVRLVGNMGMQCIKVDDSEHLYLTDGFMPTHNTYTAGVAAYLWWSADPTNSICIFTSTTREMSRRRVWPVFQHLHQTAKYQQGYLQESRTMIQCEKGNDKNAIYAMAVAKGETATAVANLKGVHAPRVMLIIDEAEGTPEAILQTIPNIRKGCSKQFIVIVIGNPVSHLDNLGRYCEPLAGWSNISVEHEQWPTKGVRAWQVDPGLCVHYDGAKSPNVVEQRTIYPYLYAWEDWQNAQASKGERTASFWSQDRGFWSPIGVTNTIFNEPMVEQYGGYETNFVFRGWSRHLAFLDPAFGGDQCKLVHAVVGDADDGRHVIEIIEQVNLASDVEKMEEVDYQIARQAIEYAKGWGVEPSGFGLDATGTGRGVAAIIASEWSTAIHRIEFGGAPSDKIASDNDPRPSHEVYDRRVTELWYSCREMLRGRQLKGLYVDAVIQFCHREFKTMARKVKLDTKEECKEKIGRSPDDADAIAGVVEVARELGAVAITGAVDRGNREWDKTVEDAHDIYNPDLAYSEPIGRQFDSNSY